MLPVMRRPATEQLASNSQCIGNDCRDVGRGHQEPVTVRRNQWLDRKLDSNDLVWRQVANLESESNGLGLKFEVLPPDSERAPAEPRLDQPR